MVSDLIRGRAIWFGGKDRSAESMDKFFRWPGPEKCGKIRLAVMDMGTALRASTLKPGHAPKAKILYDKFHVFKHLGEAIDKVRKQEYARVSGEGRRFIRGKSTRCCRTGTISRRRGRPLFGCCSGPMRDSMT